MEKIGGSICFQLIHIFKIIEDPNKSEDEKRSAIKEYQESLTREETGILLDKKREDGQCKKKGFLVFGDVDVMSYEDLVRTKQYVDNELTSFTCELEMKMQAIIAGYNKDEHKIDYRFGLADEVYDYAMSHGKAMRGHTLVWHKHTKGLDDYIQDQYEGDLELDKENNPTEFYEKRKELTKRFLGEYMKAMGEHYPNCYCWDVLNEIVPEMEIVDPTNKHCPSDAERKDGLRHSKWFEYLGKDYYIEVLKLARENLPEGTKLFYNEFGEQHPEKRAAIIKVIENIKKYEKEHPECGTLLDGIGLQSHYDLTITPEQIKQIYKDIGKVAGKHGVEIQVTEMDVAPGIGEDGKPLEYDPNDTSKHAVVWNAVFKYAKKYGVKAFTGWGINDVLSWYPNIDCTMVNKHGEPKNFRKNLTKNNAVLDYISKIARRIKSIGKKKDIKMLSEANPGNELNPESDSQKSFIESIRVSPEELAKNKAAQQQGEQAQTVDDKLDGPSLDD